jgi:hypothetical protein
MTALDCTDCVRYTGMCPAHSPLLGNMRGLRTSETTPEFHFKIITNQDVNIYVNIHITVCTALTNIDCKSFSNSHFYLFYHILSCLYLIYITVSHWLYLRNNIVIICTTIQTGLSPCIFFLFIQQPPDDGWSGELKYVVMCNKRLICWICMVVLGWIINTLLIRNTQWDDITQNGGSHITRWETCKNDCKSPWMCSLCMVWEVSFKESTTSVLSRLVYQKHPALKEVCVL